MGRSSQPLRSELLGGPQYAVTVAKEASPLVGGAGSGLGSLFFMLLPALLGTAVEFYEYTVYSSLTQEVMHNFFGATQSGLSEYGVWLVFGLGQACRPIGAILFGLFADRFGRRPTIVAATLGMILCTTAMGLLPTHVCCGGDWNLIGAVLLFVCRAVQGLSAAGELVSVMAFVVEHAPPAQAGLAFAWVLMSANVGTVIAAAYAALLESRLSTEAMLQWGWRVPFVSALPIGLAIVWAQQKMPEPEASSAAADGSDGSGRGGLLAAAGRYRRQLLIAFCLSACHAGSRRARLDPTTRPHDLSPRLEPAFQSSRA